MLEKYFKDIQITNINLLSPPKSISNSENLWRVGGARIERPNPFSSRRGVLTILLNKNYTEKKSSEVFRGVLIDGKGKELDIWSIKNKAAKSAIRNSLLAPEDLDTEAIQVEFAVNDNEDVEGVVYKEGLSLFILRVNEEKQFEVVPNSKLAFEIPPLQSC